MESTISTSQDSQLSNEKHDSTTTEIEKPSIISSSVEDGTEEAVKPKNFPGPGGRGGGLPPNHPMHPSQFAGDRFEKPALLTLAGSFCVMVCLLLSNYVYMISRN
jgi:hypothetical protein